jgi:hypothetical protein
MNTSLYLVMGFLLSWWLPVLWWWHEVYIINRLTKRSRKNGKLIKSGTRRLLVPQNEVQLETKIAEERAIDVVDTTKQPKKQRNKGRVAPFNKTKEEATEKAIETRVRAQKALKMDLVLKVNTVEQCDVSINSY